MTEAGSDSRTDEAVEPSAGRGNLRSSGAAELLDLDPELGARLSVAERRAAQGKLEVRTVALGPGEWADELSEPDLFGLLVVEGALVRRLVVGPGRSLEVLTQGDLTGTRGEAADGSGWYSSLGASRVAILERDFADRIARWPPLVEALLERALRRVEHLAAQAALDSRAGTERRVLLTLWRLAERCGFEAGEGVVVPLPLTHQMLADLVGAQRPGVSAAISRLSSAGTLARTEGRGWLLERGSAEALADAEQTTAEYAGE